MNLLVKGWASRRLQSRLRSSRVTLFARVILFERVANLRVQNTAMDVYLGDSEYQPEPTSSFPNGEILRANKDLISHAIES